MNETKTGLPPENLATVLEQPPCPLCGDSQSALHCHAPDRFDLHSGPSYAITRCQRCGMIYLNPRPHEADSSRFYEHADYLPFSSFSSRPALASRVYEFIRNLNLRWKRRMLEDFLKRTNNKLPLAPNLLAPDLEKENRGRLLDVGCGTGEFLVEMKKSGWQAEGLERDERAAAFAREHHQLAVTTGGVEKIPALTKPYEVITLWHVLEHLYNPGAALDVLANCLRDDGWLLIAVPNIAGVEARVYKGNWIALDTPRHVNHFSLETLSRLGSKHGLTLRWWRQLPMDALFNTLMSEKLITQRHGRFYLWPLRLLRALGVACASYLGGSHTPFSYASYGASLVCFFEKNKKH